MTWTQLPILTALAAYIETGTLQAGTLHLSNECGWMSVSLKRDGITAVQGSMVPETVSTEANDLCDRFISGVLVLARHTISASLTADVPRDGGELDGHLALNQAAWLWFHLPASLRAYKPGDVFEVTTIAQDHPVLRAAAQGDSLGEIARVTGWRWDRLVDEVHKLRGLQMLRPVQVSVAC